MSARRTRAVFLLLFVISLLGAVYPGDAASAHMHTHHHKKAESNERTEDGAFSPRDVDHYVDGEHHQEFDHEAILGSIKEAEEFDKLPMVESKRRLAMLLTKMDLNADKFIDRNELKAWILRSFDMLSTEESQDRLEDVDVDNDGTVSWTEILQDTYGADPEEIAADDKLISYDRHTFKAADANDDGVLDTEEFKAYTHPEETPRMFPLLMNQALKEKDMNKDGLINFQEFIGDRAKSEDKEWLITEKDKFDNEYDKNGDGILDSLEIFHWLIPSNEDIANDEVDHLFAASDDDHDNRLSFEEIVDHHDTFVGSEATDYGDHLQDMDRFNDEF